MRSKKIKFWQKLKGTYAKPIDHKDVNRLIAGIQQEIMLDQRDIETLEAIEKGKIDWSGERKL